MDYPSASNSVPSVLDREISQIYAQLKSGIDLPPVRARIESLARAHSQYPPLIVLTAQVAFIERNLDDSLDHLQPIVDLMPSYTAAALLMGHTAESLGHNELAWSTFRELVDTESVALHRFRQLEPKVLDSWIEEVDRGIASGHREESEVFAEKLSSSDSAEPRVFHALVRFAEAIGDPEAELDARRALSGRDPDLPNLRRIAELEIELGDIRGGLEHLEALFAANPDEIEVFEELELAKFLWRLRLLPPEIQQLRTEPELDRGQFAVMLYWLVPDVRFARITDPPIANDILEHQWRDQLLQVLSLRLIDIDRTLHRFFPSDPITRKDALKAWLELLHRSEKRLACVGGVNVSGRRLTGSEAVCRRSAACGLIATTEDCLPGMSLSGSETLQLFKRGLDLLAE